MGETLNGMQTDLDGRVAYATIIATTCCAPARSRRTPKTWWIHGQHAGRRGRPAVHRAMRGGVKVSFRARKGLDCSRLAAQFGGGGHKAAAGATLPGSMPESVDQVLAAVRQALDSDGSAA